MTTLTIASSDHDLEEIAPIRTEKLELLPDPRHRRAVLFAVLEFSRASLTVEARHPTR